MKTTTARDLISSSLRLGGILASGETPSATEAQDALYSLNDMIEGWSTERLLVHAIKEETFSLTISKRTYSVGEGADFDTTRPIKIVRAVLRQVGSNQNTDIPIRIATFKEWSQIIAKDISSSIPLWLYSEGTFPNETINLWPIPSVANTLVLYLWKPLTQFASLDTVVSLPPGYSRALRYNLALELSFEYGREIAPSIIQVANKAKADIKRVNIKPQYLSGDSAILPRDPSFDWRTGGTA